MRLVLTDDVPIAHMRQSQQRLKIHRLREEHHGAVTAQGMGSANVSRGNRYVGVIGVCCTSQTGRHIVNSIPDASEVLSIKILYVD